MPPGEEYLKLWAEAMVAGIPHEVFWTLTVREVRAVLEARAEQERQRFLHGSGLIAATIINVNRPKGKKMVQPSDFLRRTAPRPEDYMSPEESAKAMEQWARSHNARRLTTTPVPSEGAKK